MKDPRIMECLGVLLGVDISSKNPSPVPTGDRSMPKSTFVPKQEEANVPMDLSDLDDNQTEVILC